MRDVFEEFIAAAAAVEAAETRAEAAQERLMELVRPHLETIVRLHCARTGRTPDRSLSYGGGFFIQMMKDIQDPRGRIRASVVPTQGCWTPDDYTVSVELTYTPGDYPEETEVFFFPARLLGRPDEEWREWQPALSEKAARDEAREQERARRAAALEEERERKKLQELMKKYPTEHPDVHDS